MMVLMLACPALLAFLKTLSIIEWKEICITSLSHFVIMNIVVIVKSLVKTVPSLFRD